MAWLRDHLPLDAENLAVIHGDYHGGNLMFKNGSLSGVLDWSFCISNPAVDLAHTMNDYLFLFPRLDGGCHLICGNRSWMGFFRLIKPSGL